MGLSGIGGSKISKVENTAQSEIKTWGYMEQTGTSQKACMAGFRKKQENEAGTVFEESVPRYFLKLIKDINPRNSNEVLCLDL